MKLKTPSIVFALLLLAIPVSADEIPALLPDPDGKPGDTTKQ